MRPGKSGAATCPRNPDRFATGSMFARVQPLKEKQIGVQYYVKNLEPKQGINLRNLRLPHRGRVQNVLRCDRRPLAHGAENTICPLV